MSLFLATGCSFGSIYSAFEPEPEAGKVIGFESE